MKAQEIVKRDEQGARNSKIMMSVEGTPNQLSSVIATLCQHWDAIDYEEEGENEGEIALFFVIDRSDKKGFMLIYKQAKKNIS